MKRLSNCDFFLFSDKHNNCDSTTLHLRSKSSKIPPLQKKLHKSQYETFIILTSGGGHASAVASAIKRVT